MRCFVVYFFILFTLIATPDQSLSETTAYCNDYFRDEWNVRLDMNSATGGILNDIPDLQTSGMSGITYSDGSLQFTTTTASPRLTLLQYTVIGSIPVGTRYGYHHPIDSATYQYFVVRMYSSKTAVAQLMWFFSYEEYATTTFTVNKGWNTYAVYLPSAQVGQPSLGSNLNWTDRDPIGLVFIPVNSSGIDLKVDWIQLTRSDCSNYSASFDGSNSATVRRQAVVDDNSNPLDGVQISSSASTAITHTIGRNTLFPGTYQLYGIETGDWMTQVTGNPWDMSEEADISPNAQSNITNTSFSGGRFIGTASGNDPSFYLSLPSGPSFSAQTYKYLTIGIEYSLRAGLSSDSGEVFLFNSNGTPFQFNITALPGYQVYNIDVSGATGDIVNVRIDPVNASGSTFSLDFVELRTDAYVGSQSTVTPEAIDTLTVQDLSLEFAQPDRRGGSDYAQTVVGNSWNMNSTDDLLLISNVVSAFFYPHNILTDATGASYKGDFFEAINYPGNGDPAQFSVFSSTEIDTSRYVNVCFKGWNSDASTGYNSVARILWTDPRPEAIADPARNGDDIVMNRANREYCVDLRSPWGAQIEPPLPDGSPNPWTSITEGGSAVNFFRVDMNESTDTDYQSVIDYIHLRSDHDANTQYAISIDASLSVAVELYYNTTASTSNGTLITTLSAGRSTNIYAWNTSAIADGTYYIYGKITENGNTLSRLAEGRIQISHSRTQDSTAPILECERPNNGYLFDTSLELAGYALDETRISKVEVFQSPDGAAFSYLTSIQPDMFHLTARDLYVNMAEANNPGFQEFYAASALPLGRNVIRIVATDTAGNQTSCDRETTRSAGASTSPLTYPEANGTPIEATIGSTPTLTLATSLSGKNGIQYEVTGCGPATIKAQTSKSLLESNPITIGNVTSTARSINLPALKKGKGKASKLYFKAYCMDLTSTLKAVNAKKFKSKKATSLRGILNKVKKNFSDS